VAQSVKYVQRFQEILLQNNPPLIGSIRYPRWTSYTLLFEVRVCFIAFMEGWIKLYRKFIDWEWSHDMNMVGLFIHLVLRANHSTTKWRGETIKRGQLLTGRKQISEWTGLSDRKIRTCLNRLKSTSEVTIETTNRYSIITICNYDNYQLKPTSKPTSQRPTSDQQPTTSKNNKNNKKFTAPIVEEVVMYFKQNGYAEAAARRAFEYYNVADWKDSRGAQVKNWKQKMRGVWFKDENKIKTTYNQVSN